MPDTQCSTALAHASQVAGFPEELLAEAGKRLQVGEIIGSGQGYFKLARGAEPENGQIVDAGGTPGVQPPHLLARCAFPSELPTPEPEDGPIVDAEGTPGVHLTHPHMTVPVANLLQEPGLQSHGACKAMGMVNALAMRTVAILSLFWLHLARRALAGGDVQQRAGRAELGQRAAARGQGGRGPRARLL